MTEIYQHLFREKLVLYLKSEVIAGRFPSSTKKEVKVHSNTSTSITVLSISVKFGKVSKGFARVNNWNMYQSACMIIVDTVFKPKPNQLK